MVTGKNNEVITNSHQEKILFSLYFGYFFHIDPHLFHNSVQCSHTCGKGVKHRGVSCHRINNYGWPDPDPVSHGCNSTEKPREVETCIINGDCKHKSVLWKVGLWEPVRILYISF